MLAVQPWVVYHQCQCSLFKQFTTVRGAYVVQRQLFIINVNVLFLSNSQRTVSCTVFLTWLFIINVNVLFLSNSQLGVVV